MTDFVSLSTLRLLARQRADMENSQFVTDTEMRRYINRGYAELYDLIVTSANSEDYFLESSTVQLVSGTKTYSLPSDFYKGRGVDLTVGSDTIPLRRFNFTQRNVGSRYSVSRTMRYRFQGNVLAINPKPSTADTLTVWYIPTPKKFLEVTPSAVSRGSTTTWTVPSGHGFVADDTITGVNFLATDYNVDQTISSVTATTIVTDLDSSALSDPTSYGSLETRLDFYAGWDEYVILCAAMDALIKEEADITAIMVSKDQVRQRILAVAEMRDLGEPVTVTDISTYYTDFDYQNYL
tara:strand:+ start:1484 stop:2365 length:882 start_codon:yes stop_codon:yes gene_type:complete